MSRRPNEPRTQAMLFLAFQASARELNQTIHGGGHPALRPKHGAVFATIDRHGTRATTLASRAGITKAAMGELIDELEGLGYLERHPDKSDRRAKLVVPAPAALDVLRLVDEFNKRWEARYRRKLGREAYESLRASLRTIAAAANTSRRSRSQH